MARTIDFDALSSQIEEVIERVTTDRQSVTIERDGAPVAVISPIKGTVGLTGEEIRRVLGDLRMPDEDFADDLEAVHAELNRIERSPWDS